ncbi:MAG: PKD domain-containing protein, partial [Thermoplasmata archaeon]
IIEVTKEGYNVTRKNVTVFAGYITDAGTIGISVVNKPPIAGFVYTPSTPTTSDTIQFTDTSTDSDGTIVAWSWDFGDGTQSTLQNPTHKYSRKGIYSVTLTVIDDDGGTHTVTKTIEVAETPGSPGVSGVSSMWWLLGIVIGLVIFVAVFLVYLLKKKKKWRRTETTK